MEKCISEQTILYGLLHDIAIKKKRKCGIIYVIYEKNIFIDRFFHMEIIIAKPHIYILFADFCT